MNAGNPLSTMSQLFQGGLSQINRFIFETPLTTIVLLALTTSLGIVIISSFGVLRTVIKPYFSPLRVLKGPPSKGLSFLGYFADILKAPIGQWHDEQLKKYGHVLVYKAFLNVSTMLSWGYPLNEC